MKKKILLLGGSHAQVPAILEAKKRGLYTILADYYLDIPGKDVADEFHNVSTTDLDAILHLAKSTEIDLIFGYMSDPAALTVAYVSEKLGIPGNSVESVELLSDKVKFRKFQKIHGFKTPKFKSLSKKEINITEIQNFPTPFIVKPVDSSDTKGVYLVHCVNDFEHAAHKSLNFSRSGNIIVEEFIDSDNANFHGDAFIKNGEMVFCMLGDNLFFSTSHPHKPSSEIYPSRKPESLIKAAENEAARFIKRSGFENGPVNIEIRVNAKNEIYIMEIGPRSGGGDTPQTIYHSVGFDMLKASFDFLLNGEVDIQLHESKPTVSFILHSNENGRLEQILLDSDFLKFVAEKNIYVKPGDDVKSFDQPGSNLGVVILKFNSFEEFDSVYPNLYENLTGAVCLI